MVCIGRALVAAGCGVGSIGLTLPQDSHTLQFVGLLAFVVGLGVVIFAMAGTGSEFLTRTPC
jgi:hypothetical protein